MSAEQVVIGLTAIAAGIWAICRSLRNANHLCHRILRETDTRKEKP